ncbi:MAG: hypothetical protein WAN69_16190 [Candidatus Korobacteraceae bacterium]|jgi:hypothetical protein
MRTVRNLAQIGALTAFLTIAAIAAVPTADAQEVIDATAMGTSTQMGKVINIKLLIYSYSTPQDKKVLDEAFAKGQNQGLVNALEKMKAVGRIQIPGTIGYDVSYISSTPSPTGRTIYFVTNRKITFKEAYRNTPSQAYNLSGGEINISDQDKSKSAGVLYPAAQLVINKDGDLQIELRQNPWRLTNIIVRGTTKE